MKYRNTDTGSTYTYGEIKKVYDMFGHDPASKYATLEEFHDSFEQVEEMFFKGYGKLEWVDVDDFHTEGWSVVGRATGEDGEEYDILLSADKTTYGYSNI